MKNTIGLVVLLGVLFCSVVSADDGDPKFNAGKAIYAKQCASCHGVNGAGGTLDYDDKLVGDLSIDSLAKLVSETMPEGDPNSCRGSEAEAVTHYMFHQFYSAEAQYRQNRPQAVLSHRTVRQYRESVADLLSHFQTRKARITEQRGLKTDVFAYRSYKKGQRLRAGVEENINYPSESGGIPGYRQDDQYENVGELPKRDTKNGRGFSAYWRGAIIAPQTGCYEIVVDCPNGFKLFLNEDHRPLIDQFVRIPGKRVHEASIFLLGGRAYGFRVEMFAFKEPEAAIVVKWKTPGGSLRPIPATAFAPVVPDEVAIVDTAFPADDASSGYERGISISQQSDFAFTQAAVAIADWVAERIWKLARTNPDAQDHEDRVRQFCQRFVERAFVRTLTSEEIEFFVHQHFVSDVSLLNSVRRVVILCLKSPEFLYPLATDRPASLAVAETAARLLWDSIPDRELYKLAARGELNDHRQGQQWDRMIADRRSREKMRSFFRHWLKIEPATDVTKDDAAFPGFDSSLQESLYRSLEIFLDEVIWSRDSDFRELFLSDRLYINEKIANFYSIDLKNSTELAQKGFHRVAANAELNGGLLTHPFLMAGLAYSKDSSPIHRGVFVARNLLGRRLRQPPDDVEPLTDEFAPSMTTRQRVEHQTKATACMSCHSVINPLGFSLENYDAVGRLRFKENKRPIDVKSIYETPAGEAIELSGARDLAVYLANSPDAQKSFIRQIFQYYVKQPVGAFGQQTLDKLHADFTADNFNTQSLLKNIVKVVVRWQLRQNSQRQAQEPANE